MQSNYIVYSPITHNHPIAKQVELPLGWEFWKQNDEVFLEWCDEVWVLDIPGWEESKGVAAEIEIANELKKTIKHIRPDQSFLEQFNLDDEKEIPFLAVGKDELKNNKSIFKGDIISCPNCNKQHIVECAVEVETGQDGTLLFYKCDKQESSYLVGIKNRLIKPITVIRRKS